MCFLISQARKFRATKALKCYSKWTNSFLKHPKRLCNQQTLTRREVENIETLHLRPQGLKYFFTAMTEKSLFEGHLDRFNGVTVDSMTEPCNEEQFDSVLENSLEKWIEAGRRGIWFKVALEHSFWVPHLAKKGFRFHRAQPSTVVMVRWLPENEVCNIPPYAHTMTGVGAIVVNEKRELLVVQEKHYKFPHWKLPGGYVEPGEELSTAAEREVLEETSVRAHFKQLVCFRHLHNGNFDCSDLYFIVALTPEPGQEVLKKCDREIEAIAWMNIEEYLNHPKAHSTNRFFVNKFLEYEKSGISLGYHNDTHPLLKIPYRVYSLDLGSIVNTDKESHSSKI